MGLDGQQSQPRPAWDERNDDWLRGRWAAGAPLAEIAADCGVSLGAVMERVHALGFPPRDPKGRLLAGPILYEPDAKVPPRVGGAALAAADMEWAAHRGARVEQRGKGP